MISLLNQIQQGASTSGSGLDIQALVDAIITAGSTKLNKLQAKVKANNDTITLDNTVMSKISSVKSLYDKTVVAANSPTATTESISTAMTNFVNGFNDLVTTAKGTTDRAVRDSVLALHLAVSGSQSQGTDGYKLLAQTGVVTNREGTLSFDPSALAAKFSSDPDATRNLLSNVGQAISSKAFMLTGYNSGMGAETISLTKNNMLLNDQIQREQSRLTQKSQSLYIQYSKMEAAIASMNAIGQSFNKLG